MNVSRRGFLGALAAVVAAPRTKALPLGEWQVVEVPAVNLAAGLRYPDLWSTQQAAKYLTFVDIERSEIPELSGRSPR